MRKSLLLVLVFPLILSLNTRRVGVREGDNAPEISFTGPSGDTFSLSKLKGNLVLVDFWASWCRPCREENPKIVKLYQKYKEREFDKSARFVIFSVSLDREKDKWIRAIHDDNLSWPYHICDFSGWKSPIARIYGVESIPTTYLLDEKGEVIGTDLSPKQIEFLLKGRLK